MEPVQQTPVVLRRSAEARFLRIIGILAYSVSLILFAGALLVGEGVSEWSVLLGAALVVFLRGCLISIRELFKQVVLLENYISFSSWGLVRRTYTYNQISELETVQIKDSRFWRLEPETYVKVTFNDRKVLKVQASLMSVREFRRHLSQKAGRRFRKRSTKSRIKR